MGYGNSLQAPQPQAKTRLADTDNSDDFASLHPSLSLFPPQHRRTPNLSSSGIRPNDLRIRCFTTNKQVADSLVILMTTQHIRQVIITTPIQLNHDALMPGNRNATHLTIVGVL